MTPTAPATALARVQATAADAARTCAVLSAAALALPTFWLSAATAAFVACWLVAWPWADVRALLRGSAVARAALALAAWLLLSTLWSPLPWPQNLAGFWPYRKLLLLIALLATLRDPVWGWRMLYAFLAAFALLLGLSYGQALGLAPANRWHTPSGYTSHIAYSLMLAFATWTAGWLAWARPAQRRAWALYAALGVFNLFFINTGRTGQAVFFLLLLVQIGHGLMRRWRWRGLLLAGVVGLGLAALLWSASATLRERTLEGLGDIERARSGEVNTSLAYRLDFWGNTLALAQQHPWLGQGAGSFASIYQQLAAQHGWTGARVSHNPHSEYLLVWIQGGLVALALLLYLATTLWRVARQLAPPVPALAHGLFLIVGTAALFNSLLYDHQDGHFFIIMTAALLAAGQRAAPTRPPLAP